MLPLALTPEQEELSEYLDKHSREIVERLESISAPEEMLFALYVGALGSALGTLAAQSAHPDVLINCTARFARDFVTGAHHAAEAATAEEA